MRRFASRSLLFAALQVLIAASVLEVSGYYDPGRAPLMALVDKHAALARTDAPRVLIAGDSSGAFGWRSEIVSRRIGRPVVNLALHIGLGLPYALREAREAMRPGDLVVLNVVYQHFEGLQARGMVLALSVLHRPRSIAYLGRREYRLLLDDFHVLMGSSARSLLRRTVGGPGPYVAPYRRDDFTPGGDINAYRGAPLPPVDLGMTPLRDPPGNLEPALCRLEAFVSAAGERGVTVALAFPALVDEVHERNRPAIGTIHRALQRIPGLILLDTPGDEAYPRGWFYDNFYHLDTEGAARRSDRLAGRIGDVLRSRVDARWRDADAARTRGDRGA